MRRTVLLVFLLAAASAADAGPTVTLPATKDNSIVLYAGEEHLNAGSKRRIRLKGNQHLLALDFDFAKVRGKLVKRAVLVCTPAAHRVAGVTVSTIQAPWSESGSNALTSGVQPHEGWAWPGARFPALTGSNAFSLFCQAPTTGGEGDYRWEIDPDLVHANALGLVHGLCVHEWSADYSRNPTVFSREEPGKGPRLVLELGGGEPGPGPVDHLEVHHRVDAEAPRLRLVAPKAGFAYLIEVNGRPLPRWNTPFVRPGKVQWIPIRDIPLRPGREFTALVVVVNRTGKRSESRSVSAVLPKRKPVPRAEVPLPKLAARDARVQVLPLCDKVGVSGEEVGRFPDNHRIRNAVFDGRTIRLAAAKGEVVGFQLLISGQVRPRLKVSLGGLRKDVWRGVHVEAGGRRLPDPLVPADGLRLDPDVVTPLFVDVYVPYGEKRKLIEGSVRISDGKRIPIALRVRDFDLPREASFLCEMNSYGLPDSVVTYERLQEIAYDHRVHVNILHYSHRTAAPGARKCNLDMRMRNGDRMDEKRYNAIRPGERAGYWDDFAAAFGPLLTGRYFARGHRGPIALPGFYLTFHESWPLNVRAHFDGNPDAYEAFRNSPEYSQTFAAVLRDFEKRLRRERWGRAGFQVYLNNKGSLEDPAKAPWVLDEPASFFDYRALAYYGDLVTRGLAGVRTGPVRYRIDISRPQFDRGQLWRKADLWVVNTGAFRKYPRLLLDRRERNGLRVWVYGSSNKVDESNRTIINWVLEAYRGGATGVVPWQTIDKTGRAMRKGDPLGLFVFDGEEGGFPVIRPSLRLKAYRRAQQDVEYLEVLRRKVDLAPSQMRDFIDRYVDVRAPVTAETAESHRRLREAAAALIETAR